MKMFGIGTALAVVIDATIIRGVVVPAFLRVAGEFNWWAPKPLRWLHSRIGISEALSFAVDEVTAKVPHLAVSGAGRPCPPGRSRHRSTPRGERERRRHRGRQP